MGMLGLWVCVPVLVLDPLLFAQVRPNFSGRWVALSGIELTGPERLSIRHTEKSIAIQVVAGIGVDLVEKTYALGNDLPGGRANAESSSQVEWVGDALVVTVKHGAPGKNRWAELSTYSLDREQRLVVMYLATALSGGVMDTKRIIYGRE